LSHVFSRRLALLALSSCIGLVGLVSIVAIAAISAGLGSTRTFVLEAQATGLNITFSGQFNDWALGPTVVCTPRAKIIRTLPRGSGKCDSRRYLEEAVESFRINWSNGASVEVTSPTPGVISLEIFEQLEIADRTRLIVERDGWMTTGALTFNGTARIGDQLASGETKMVLSGSYEAREKPLWSEKTEVLKSGLIRRGESAAVLAETATGATMAEVYGHITPADGDQPGFIVGAVSAPGLVFLQLGFFGATTPTQIAPNWIDRALTSPLILALAALLSVVLSAGQIVGNATAALRSATGAKKLDEVSEANEAQIPRNS
jgi:hypothetical protein